MFPVVATVNKVEYDSANDCFLAEAEVVLSQEVGHFEIMPKEIDESWQVQPLINKPAGTYKIRIAGPGRSRLQKGTTLNGRGFSKGELP
jgi:hypothetical protein